MLAESPPAASRRFSRRAPRAGVRRAAGGFSVDAGDQAPAVRQARADATESGARAVRRGEPPSPAGDASSAAAMGGEPRASPQRAAPAAERRHGAVARLFDPDASDTSPRRARRLLGGAVGGRTLPRRETRARRRCAVHARSRRRARREGGDVLVSWGSVQAPSPARTLRDSAPRRRVGPRARRRELSLNLRARTRPSRVSSRASGSARFRSARAWPSAGASRAEPGETHVRGRSPPICAARRGAARASPRRATEGGGAKHRVRVTGSTPPCAPCPPSGSGAGVPTAASTSSATRAIADSCERAVAPASAPPPPPARGSRSLLETAASPAGPSLLADRAAPMAVSAPLRTPRRSPGGAPRSARTNAVSDERVPLAGRVHRQARVRSTPLAALLRRQGKQLPPRGEAASDAAAADGGFSAHSAAAAASAQRPRASHSFASARPPSFCVQRSSGSNGSGGSERPEALTAFDGLRSGGDVPPFRSRAHSAATEFRFPSKSAPIAHARGASRVDARTPSPGALAPSGPRSRSPRGDARARRPRVAARGSARAHSRARERDPPAPSEEAPRTDRFRAGVPAPTAEASLLFSDAVASCMAALYEA